SRDCSIRSSSRRAESKNKRRATAQERGRVHRDTTMLATIEQRLASAAGASPRVVVPRLVGRASPAWLDMLERRGRAASVLMPLIQRPGGLTLLMTERAAHLREHAGQISFPGGRLASAEETPIAAALREATEEIGLPPEDVRVLGQLDMHLTTTGFEIT